MSGRLFVPQPQLDAWLEGGQVDVTADGLEVPGESRVLPLEPAFRFISLLEGEDDADLLGRVKTEVELRQIDADPCGDSVLLGEVAYEVVPGFLASVPMQGSPGMGLEAPAVREGESAPVQPTPAAGAGKGERDAELLSALFLGRVK